MTDQLTENRPLTKSPEESNGETIIEIKNLKKGFGKQVVLNDVSQADYETIDVGSC